VYRRRDLPPLERKNNETKEIGRKGCLFVCFMLFFFWVKFSLLFWFFLFFFPTENNSELLSFLVP
jgi:hypothetical protein